jgi:hypothetical protein
MTTTVTPRPSAVRQPYFRPLAARTALWTTVLVTALVGGQFVGLTLGLSGVPAGFVGAATATALGMVAHAAVADRARWAQITLAVLWLVWPVVGYANRGWSGSTLPLIEGVALTGAVVAVVLALSDVWRQRVAGR